MWKMSMTQNCCCQWRWGHVMIAMILLLLGSMWYPTEGRNVLPGVTVEAGLQRDGKVVKGSERRLIGSSPPRCERRCSNSCGRCQAVQVPVTPQQQQRPRSTSRLFRAAAAPRIAYSRGRDGGDGSNYKPMAWKCKCGNLLFNP
ncbi:hypothetical protein SAY86_016548 [Trapa natans]|uniref:Epidermal patterning factor-like protein n=1 Tax=Trapa natans TaxID=22666 RepID=A0AAN7QZK3_TRANT|nr:hypothetical protein SAY86_016548 [Trapa natans]